MGIREKVLLYQWRVPAGTEYSRIGHKSESSREDARSTGRVALQEVKRFHPGIGCSEATITPANAAA